ncbi:LacI family transcriptional regulator [Planosporangium thailandense]|uniref:LacI family transcriptional regulator n=1 Tax=Planosporangium thailandense TaxID=765197 RepID=A0ABX0XTH3_9ACTN|nr:LacI family DNA-binding transcriptional regulator [Planosporangium thailandense]NJC68528.1 LacI family transcriptional regulator [Planosporangium thailandense]
MAASIKDVAARAGVSVKTVSNVVNGYQFVAAGTREKVQRALDELGYRPNLSARRLRGGRTGLIALAVPEIRVPYFAELAAQFVQLAKEYGWTVLIDETQGALDNEREVVEGIKSHLIDGLIVSPLALTAKHIEARRDRTPLVLLGERLTHAPVDHVSIDNVAGAQAAVAHLADLGRTRIAAIGSQPHISGGTAALRLKGYRQALRRARLAYDPALVMPVTRFHRADGARAMQALLDLEQPPDAVFCFNDLMALGAIRTLLARGCRVPQDVAVIGFDDIEEGQFSTPTLSTVAPDKEQIARLALRLVHQRIGARDDAQPQEETADFRLVVRESTAPAG